ncbi:MAG: phosphoesterase [Algoriphagus sp.]|nr:phosphoesterase [Algoriphagus sp.]
MGEKDLRQVRLDHNGTTLFLMKEKVVYHQNTRTFFISDVHFGKAAHFRKSGIPIPEPIHKVDLETLSLLFDEFSPSSVYFLGDLFHSDWNGQWDILMDFLETYPAINFHLVQGNHDILPPSFYKNCPIAIHKQPVFLENLILSHEPLEDFSEGYLNLCGHIHPGIKLRGMGRQSLRLSCFYLENNQLILPAFGSFTGLALIKPGKEAKVYGITSEKVIPLLS